MGQDRSQDRRQCPLIKGLWLILQRGCFLEADVGVIGLVAESPALSDIHLSRGANSLASAKAHPYGEI